MKFIFRIIYFDLKVFNNFYILFIYVMKKFKFLGGGVAQILRWGVGGVGGCSVDKSWFSALVEKALIFKINNSNLI